MRPEDYLPISMLNQFEYCPRRFWYMHVLGEMDINAPVLEGTYQHEQAHTPGASREGETTTQRRVYVWSDRLQIAGFADIVTEAGGALTPIEYKHGRMGRWLNDHIQLCAQAMCIEERLQISKTKDQIPNPKSQDPNSNPVWRGANGVQTPTAHGEAVEPSNVQSHIAYGEIFYWGSRRRERVEFTAELRARTEQSIARVFALLAQGQMPPPIEQRAKCRDCSLQPICLPDEVVTLSHHKDTKTPGHKEL